jgi:hypothetical protein
MRIDLENKGELCVVHLKGRFITGFKADYMQTRDALRQGGYRKVIVDCRPVYDDEQTAIAALSSSELSDRQAAAI